MVSSLTNSGVEPPQQSHNAQFSLTVPASINVTSGSTGAAPEPGTENLTFATRKTVSAPVPHAGNNIITSRSLGSIDPLSIKSAIGNENVCHASDGLTPSELVFKFTSVAPVAPPDSTFNIQASLPPAGALTTFKSNESTPFDAISVTFSVSPVPPSVVRAFQPNTVPELPFNTLNSATEPFSASSTNSGVEPPQQSHNAQLSLVDTGNSGYEAPVAS